MVKGWSLPGYFSEKLQHLCESAEEGQIRLVVGEKMENVGSHPYVRRRKTTLASSWIVLGRLAREKEGEEGREAGRAQRHHVRGLGGQETAGRYSGGINEEKGGGRRVRRRRRYLRQRYLEVPESKKKRLSK